MFKKKDLVEGAKERAKIDIYKNKPYNRVVGIDVANSTIKIWTDNGKHMEYRNTVKEVNDAGLVYSFKTDYQMYVLDKEVYEVGDISAMGSGGRGNARYNSNAFRTEALIGITRVLSPGTTDKIKVVTGLPSSLSRNTAIADELKKTLIGSYSIKSVQWDNVDEISFEIVEVVVVPQPLGTLYNFVYNEDKGELDKTLLSQRGLVIDIGWGTTDLAVLEDSRVRGTFGFEIGVSDYIANLQESANDLHPEARIYSLNPHQLDHALLESTTVQTPFGKFDLESLLEKHKAIQARRVYESVMSLGLEFNKFYWIILTGGGALQYETALKELFNDPRIRVKEDAITSNAKGFYLLGQF